MNKTILSILGAILFVGISCVGCGHSYPQRQNNQQIERSVQGKKDSRGPRFFSKKMRLEKYNQQKGICPHCKKKCQFNEMQGDHIVPYSKGGRTEWNNLQMLCAPCNKKKGNRYSY